MSVKMLPALIVVAAVAAAPHARAQAYRWTDEKGHTVYSDTPPPSGVAQPVELEPAPPPGGATRARTEVEQIEREADAMQSERVARERQRQERAAEKKDQEAACAQARARLAKLEEGPPNRRLVIGPDGTATRVSEDEMQRLLGQARADVARRCAGG